MPTPDTFIVQTVVAGLTFHQYKQLQDEIVTHSNVEPRLYLEPDAGNEYDPNAMKVMWQDSAEDKSGWIGFIPMKISEQVKLAHTKHEWCDIIVLDHDRAKSYKDRLTIAIRCYSNEVTGE